MWDKSRANPSPDTSRRNILYASVLPLQCGWSFAGVVESSHRNANTAGLSGERPCAACRTRGPADTPATDHGPSVFDRLRALLRCAGMHHALAAESFSTNNSGCAV